MYGRGKSYVDPQSFVRVWNYGTAEFSPAQPIFECMPFERVYQVASKLPPSDRGNRQFGVGVSTQNLKGRCAVTQTAEPQLVGPLVVPKGSEGGCGDSGWDDMLQLVSVLSANVCGYLHPAFEGGRVLRTDTGCPEVQRHLLRHTKFAAAIAPNQWFEFGTGAVNDAEAPYILWHCDQHNDPQQGYSVGIIFSRLVSIVGLLEGPVRLARVAWIACQRKAVPDFLGRVVRDNPVVTGVSKWLNGVEKWRRSLVKPQHYFANIGKGGSVYNGCMMTTAVHADKSVATSAYTDVVFRFMSRFNPTLERVLELCLPIAWSTSPYAFWTVVSCYLRSGELPEQCLSLDFVRLGTEMCKTIVSGPAPRHSPCVNKSFRNR